MTASGIAQNRHYTKCHACQHKNISNAIFCNACGARQIVPSIYPEVPRPIAPSRASDDQKSVLSDLKTVSRWSGQEWTGRADAGNTASSSSSGWEKITVVQATVPTAPAGGGDAPAGGYTSTKCTHLPRQARNVWATRAPKQRRSRGS